MSEVRLTGFQLRENRGKAWLWIHREKEGKENTGASPTNNSYWL